MVEGGSANIRVAVRCRPILGHEQGHGQGLLHAEAKDNSVSLGSAQDPSGSRRMFFFDNVLDSSASQGDVYSQTRISDLVGAVLAGYHATVFAYGQTGSGKTFTMEGFKYNTDARAPEANFDTADHDLGIIPRAIHQLYADLKRAGGDGGGRKFAVRCSYVQIYKEQVYDLINPQGFGGRTSRIPTAGMRRDVKGPGAGGGPTDGAAGLRLRWTKSDGFYLEGLTTVPCGSPSEVLDLFKAGVQNKVMASHRMNVASSRSHSLFTLEVSSTDRDGETLNSKLSLVDLAGSERAASSGTHHGELMQESIFINKSLFTLRKVISALAEKRYQGIHVPYRDSKLTSLLKHSLGGNSLTLMIACLAPSDGYREENMSTLEYASRAKHITNRLQLNEDPKTKLIRELRAENSFLREHLHVAGGGDPTALQALLAKQSPGGTPLGTPGSTPRASAAPGDKAGDKAATAAINVRMGETDAAGAALGARAGAAEAAGAAAAAAAAQSEAQHVVEVGERLADSVKLIRELVAANQGWRQRFGALSERAEHLGAANEDLEYENSELRERLSMLEEVVAMDPQLASAISGEQAQQGQQGQQGAGGGAARPDVHSASNALLLEVLELRGECQALREKVARWESKEGSASGARRRPGGGGGGGGAAGAGRAGPTSRAPPGAARGGAAAGAGAARPKSPTRRGGAAAAAGGLMSLDQLKGVLEGSMRVGAGAGAGAGPGPGVGGGGAPRGRSGRAPPASEVMPPPPSILADLDSEGDHGRTLRVSTTGRSLPRSLSDSRPGTGAGAGATGGSRPSTGGRPRTAGLGDAAGQLEELLEMRKSLRSSSGGPPGEGAPGLPGV